MQLSWDSDQAAIARALMTAYPEVDRLSLSLSQLHHMIASLSCFAASQRQPDEKRLRSVLWTWMRLSDEGEAHDIRS